MKKSSTINTFQQGLIMDLNPITTPNNVMTNALNATIVTYNGNEDVLQNDQGNARVETAFLPEGFIPLGTTELGGIIYVVSYNPQLDKCQIGCFPSPERNFTSDELDINGITLKSTDFVENDIIVKELVKKQLTDFILNPGDKFKVAGNSIKSNWQQLIPIEINNSDDIINILGNVRLKLGTLDSNGQLIELDESSLIKYTYPENPENPEDTKTFIIQDGTIESTSGTDIDNYRKLIGTDYNIFQSKIAGELYLIAKLAVINSFDVTYDVTNVEENQYTFNFYFNTTNNYDEFGDVQLIRVKTEINEGSENKTVDDDSIEAEKVSDGVFDYTKKLTYTKGATNIITYTFTPILQVGYYPLLTTSITINLDLIGTGAIQSTIWKYYKNPSSMKLYFNLELYPLDNEVYNSLQLYFIRYDNLPENNQPSEDKPLTDKSNNYEISYTHTISKRKSYSGSYTEEISFGNGLEEDSLYLVVFEFQITKGEDVTYKRIYRCLYTNGVFNQQYTDINKLDFDELTLDFNWIVSYTNNVQQVKLQPSISREPEFSNHEQVTWIRGEQKYEGEWKIELNPQLDITNKYNTFSVNQEGISITGSINNTEHTRQSELKNSSGEHIDQDFVQLVYPEDSEFINSSVETSVENNIYSIKGQFYIPISANTVAKQCTAEELFKPAISNLDELENTYGFTMANGHFSHSNTYIGLGMSNGGTDNQGGGGLYSVHGIVNYIDNNNIPGVPSAECGNAGLKDSILNFPDSTFSNYIEANSPYPIVPVFMKWTGYGQLRYQGNYNKYYADSDDGGKVENFRKTWFEEVDRHQENRVLWIFVKDNDESIDKYHATNTFLRITNVNTTLVGGGKTTAMDILVSLLMTTFVKVVGSSYQFEIYTVDDYSYYETVIESITSDIKFSVSDTADCILFNGKSLSKIYSDFQKFTGKGFNCLTFTGYNTGTPIITEVTNQFTLTNSLIDQYLHYYQENPVVDKEYVNIFNNIENIQLPENTESSVYFIGNIQGNSITLSTGTHTVYLVEFNNDSQDTFKFNLTNTPLNGGVTSNRSQITNYLTYNNRDNKVLLDRSKITSAPTTYAYFLCHDSSSDLRATNFKDISIGKNYTGANLADS